MAKQNIGIPKGTRDFSPEIMVKRNYIFNVIRNVFQKYGYLPIETPSMENIETLTGKYGEEGDQLLFKILNSRPHDAKEDKKQAMTKAFSESLQKNTNSPLLTEKALRYDLTVPFARFVVQHQANIQFPFKRYQIQPVWRADRPQKGRYREFYQCDADIVGSSSLFNEVELIQILDDVFTQLNIHVTIKLNNRKILAGIAELTGHADKLTDITTAIDKLDKIGEDNVKDELLEKEISQDAVSKIIEIIKTGGDNTSKLKTLKNHLENTVSGPKGIEELEAIFEFLSHVSINNIVETDFTLARGLNYYTGAIIEVKARDVKIGSISGGGRYDDLTGIFGMPGMSGVGISFGADRIYDVLEQLNGFPGSVSSSIDILFVNFGNEEAKYCLPAIEKLRKLGKSAILYPDNAKMKKQMFYANALNIPYVALAGENEISAKKITIKKMDTGQQKLVHIEDTENFMEF